MVVEDSKKDSEPPGEIDNMPEKVQKKKLMPIFELLKMAYYGVSHRDKVWDRAGAFLGIYFPTIIFCGLAKILLYVIYGEPKATQLSNLVVLVFLIPLCALLLGILRSFHSESKFSFFEIYGHGFKRLFSFLWLAILYQAIVLIGLCFLIIPGILLGIRYVLSPAVLVIESKKGFKALTRSKVLAKTHYFYLLESCAACVGTIILTFLLMSLFAGEITLMIVNVIIITYSIMFISCIYYLTYSELVFSEKYNAAAASLNAQQELEELVRQYDEWKESWISRGKSKKTLEEQQAKEIEDSELGGSGRWKCPSCESVNGPDRSSCYSCGQLRPA